MEQFLDNFSNHLSTPTRLDVTENGAKAFSTSGSWFVDLFLQTVRDFNPQEISQLLSQCWAVSPIKTVQLILYTRDCRGGKGEIKLGRFMMAWLREFHPFTYVLNLNLLVGVGYFKDLWKILDIVEEKKLPSLNHPEIAYFAQVLETDAKNEGSISLACKWTPSEKSHYRKYLFQLVDHMYPGDKQGLAKFRKWLKPMKEKINTLERMMCAKKWDEIDFQKVPAYAMKLNSSVLKKHDKERFEKYISSKETKVNITAIQPHELVSPFLTRGKQENADVLEKQWETLVEKVKKENKLGNCLAVSDVSGSMKGQPIEVAISLGLLLSLVQAKESPFYKKVITFSQDPELHVVQGEALWEQVTSMAGMKWEMNTNFVAVFKLLLDMAVMYKVPQESFITRVFCFTDMQFDSAAGNKKTPFQEIKSMYEKVGYKMPALVFWNLSGSGKGGIPVTIDENNVALVSGFSPQLLKLFIEGETFNPETIVEKALAKYPGVKIHKKDSN